MNEQFPSLQNRELYNQHKMESMASDVYVLGNAVVNNNEDLLQICVDLKNAVTILQQTVKDLTNNVTALHEKIDVHDHHVPQVAVTGNLLGRGTDNHNKNQQNHIRERNLVAQGDQTDESDTTSTNVGVASNQWQVNQLQDNQPQGNQPQSNRILPPRNNNATSRDLHGVSPVIADPSPPPAWPTFRTERHQGSPRRVGPSNHQDNKGR